MKSSELNFSVFFFFFSSGTVLCMLLHITLLGDSNSTWYLNVAIKTSGSSRLLVSNTS